MIQYTYIAKDQKGSEVRDSLYAESRTKALYSLREQGLTVMALSTADDNLEAAGRGTKKIHINEHIKKHLRYKKVSLNEIAVFCRQLAVLVNSRIPILQALRGIASDMDTPHLRSVINEAIDNINQGMPFSDAVAKYANIFSPVFIALIRSAEESGNLSNTLNYIALHFERLQRLHQKIRSITAYPIFIMIFMMLAIIISSFFLLPRFESLFTGFGAQLPLITRVVFGVNRVLVRLLPLVIVVGIGGGIYLGYLYKKAKFVRYRIDAFVLTMPLFGYLVRKAILSRFCRTLSVLLRGGVAIGIALDIAARVCNNRVLEACFAKVRDKITTGATITETLAADKNFPSLLVQLVSAGEVSGQLPEVLDSVSNMYDDQVETTVLVLTSLFEPLAISFFGALILVLILAIYVPVFKIAMSMRGG